MVAGLLLSRRRGCLPLYLYLLVDTAPSQPWAAPRYRLPSDALVVFTGRHWPLVDRVRRWQVTTASSPPRPQPPGAAVRSGWRCSPPCSQRPTACLAEEIEPARADLRESRPAHHRRRC
jgi:hypothetical protein